MASCCFKAFAISEATGQATAQTVPADVTATVAKPDLSTVDGAIDAYTQAVAKKDLAAMSRFFFAENSTDGRFALANAKRILSAMALEQAVNQHVGKSTGKAVVEAFNLLDDDLDFPKMYTAHEHGDLAIATVDGPEQKAQWFKKVAGVWQQDITPPPPFTVVDRAQDMEEDAGSVERITQEVNEGKIKTLRQVRDELGQAMLNAPRTSDLQVEGDPTPAMHPRPDPHGQFPHTPATPAGAMNCFVQAVQKFDEASLRDLLYMPNDKDGSCKTAASHDLVVGMHFLQAAESKFHDHEDSDRICYWLGVIARDSLRDYTDDEWYVLPDYPDLAMSSHASIPAAGTSNSQMITWLPLMHHCPDGLWRIGPRFPKNVRQLRAQGIALAKRDTILERAVVDIRAGKYPTDGEAIYAIRPDLMKVDPSPNVAGFQN